MLLQINFTLLLASVLLLLSCTGDVQAAPAKRGAVVSMPIRSIHHVRDTDIHPHIYLQQHINRSLRRLARMTGSEEPSMHELRDNLQKRVDGVHMGFAAGTSSHSKRYIVRPAKTASSFVEGPAKDYSSTGRFTANQEKAQLATAAAGNTKAAAAGQSKAAAGTGSNAAAGAQAAGNSGGVSAIDVQASQKGGLTNGGTPTANQSLALDIEANDVGYIGQVQIGTPPKNFLLLMDSGSADFWVGAENCQSQQGGGCGKHNFLGTTSSSSFKASTQQFKVTYGTGNVAGTLATDNVVLAGLPLQAHVFGTASSESVDFSSDKTPFDGLIGLAQSTLSQQKTLTPIESLAKAGTVQKAITSYKISRLADQKNDGEITFGGVDSTKFDTNTLVTIKNVNTQGFWEAPMVATVNGKSAGLEQGRTAILDTGTTLIVAPPADAAAIHNLISGAKSDGKGGFTVPCTMTDIVTMTFGGQKFDINPKDVAFLPVQLNNPTGDCISGISSGTIGGPQEWLVGDVFLKNAYFSTNVNDNTVSLAKLK